MKRKIFLTLAFIISLIPMIANQYGGIRGVREISGFINIWNPIGMAAVVLFLIGVWLPFKKPIIGKCLSISGLILMIASEITMFLTWPIPVYENAINIQYSFKNAFPEFYLGVATSALMLITYACVVSLPDRTVSTVSSTLPHDTLNAKSSTSKSANTAKRRTTTTKKTARKTTRRK